MEIKITEIYNVSCDGKGCFNNTDSFPIVGDTINYAEGCGWIQTLDKEWLCPECKRYPVKENRNKMNAIPIVDFLFVNYGINYDYC
jgi:hypothetical protein